MSAHDGWRGLGIEGDDVLAAIFDAAPFGMALVADNGSPLCANARLQQMLGMSEEELGRRTLEDLTHPGDAAAEVALFEELLDGRRDEYQLQKRLSHRDGTPIWVRQTVSGRRGVGQRLLVVTVEDVTAAHATEDRLRDLVYALGERVKELSALHGTAKVLLEVGRQQADLLGAVVDLLPPAMQYPEIATAQIRYGDETHTAGDHQPSDWALTAPFTTAEGLTGAVEVRYHQARHLEAHGVFLQEETALLGSIAEMLRASIDRHVSERALRETKERLDLAFITAGMGIWEWDITRDQVSWSLHLSRLLGLAEPPSGPFGGLGHLVHPDDRDGLFSRLQEAADGLDDLDDLEFRMKKQDGQYLHLAAQATVVRRAPARAERIMALLVDVTERRRVMERNRLLQRSIDINADAAYWLDSENRIVYANETAHKRLGYEPSGLIGLPLRAVAPDATPEGMRRIWDLLRRGEKYVAHSIHRTRDGTLFPVLISTTYVQFDGAEYACGFARDEMLDLVAPRLTDAADSPSARKSTDAADAADSPSTRKS